MLPLHPFIVAPSVRHEETRAYKLTATPSAWPTPLSLYALCVHGTSPYTVPHAASLVGKTRQAQLNWNASFQYKHTRALRCSSNSMCRLGAAVVLRSALGRASEHVHVRVPTRKFESSLVEQPLGSWWYPTVGAPGLACGHACPPPREVGARRRLCSLLCQSGCSSPSNQTAPAPAPHSVC
jgi:hypothetical protein